MEDNAPKFGPRKKFAKNLAQKLLKDSKIFQAPVRLELIIESIKANYDLSIMPIENASERISGLLVVCKEENREFATIGFNPNHPFCRQRFTIAHEIGHLLLGHTCTSRDDGTYNEREANAFAAELLVPTSLLKQDYRDTTTLRNISSLYRVSDSTMWIRLTDLRLV